MPDLAIVISVAALLASILGPVITSFMGNRESQRARDYAVQKEQRERDYAERQAIEEAKEVRYRDRLEFLRQALDSLIILRGGVARKSPLLSPDDRLTQTNLLAKAHAIIISIPDVGMRNYAEAMKIFDPNISIGVQLASTDDAIRRLGELIAEHLEYK